MASDTVKSMPFIKNLASSDRKLRTSSLTALQSFLTSRRTSSRRLSELDCLKLWKSLFFALWMTDRPLPQQSLCSELASLHTLLPAASVPVWWSAFFQTMAKEWTTGIDVLRMNKFLLLVRRMVGSMFAWPGSRGWQDGDKDAEKGDEETGEGGSVLQVLEEWVFEREGDLRKVPIGLRLHVMDVWIDELDSAGLLVAKSSRAQGFVRSVADMVEALEKCPIKAVRERAKECKEDDRLPWNVKGDGEGGNDTNSTKDGDGSWDGFDD